MHKNVGPLH